MAQSLRTLVRSARLHSLCSAHSLVIPVEAGAFAVLGKNFVLQTPVYFLRRIGSGSLPPV